MGVLPAGEGQAEMVQPVIEWRAGDADAAIAHVGKVGQPEPAWRMLLPEDDVLLGPRSAPARCGCAAPACDGCRRRSRGRRRRISSKMATGRKPGVLLSNGTTSLSQTAASGSRRRRARGTFFCDGSRGSSSMR